MIGTRRALLSSTGIKPLLQYNFTKSSVLPPWLAFSRAGNAMMFDSTGTLTYAPNNLLTYSNTFTNAAWTKTAISVTSGIADPFSGTNASTLTATASATLYQSNTGLNGVNAVSSIWIRRRTGTGAVTLWTPGIGGNTTLPLTSSWQQFSTYSVGGGTSYFYLTMSTTGDAIDVYGATLSAVTYEAAPRAGDQVVTGASAYYGPRFDYPNSTAAGLLLESVAATNVVLYSNDLTNTAWAKSNITAALNQTGADGVANGASSITATSANGAVLQSITLGSSARAQSALVKRITGTGAVYMTTDGGTTWTAITITGSWASQTIPIQTLANPSVGFKLATNGDAIAVQYVQNETTQQSSPIPTTTASATRASESLTATPAALGWSDTTGTLIVEGTFDPVVENGIIASIQGVNILELQRGNTSVGVPGQYAGQFASAGGAWSYDAATNLTNGSPARMGVQVISAVPYLSVNGGALVNGGSISFLASTVIGFGDRGGSFRLNYHLRSLGGYSAAMSSAVFRAKTTVGASYS